VTVASSTAGPDLHGDGERQLFFVLLLTATAIPYVLFPLLIHVLPRAAATDGIVHGWLFLGAGCHVAASFFFYDDRDVTGFMRDGRSARFLFVPIALVALSGIAFTVGDQTFRNYAIVAFWVWQVHHFTRQNHGVLAFAARADGMPVTTAERTAITLTNIAAVLATLVFVTPLTKTVLAPHAWLIYAVALGVFACAWIAYGLSRPLRRLRAAPWRATIMLALMGFYLPLFVFTDPFSAVYIFLTAHGLQYLVFMYFVARRPADVRARRLRSLVAFTLLGGAVIYLLQRPAIWTTYGEGLLGLSYGIIMWHFVLDAGVWRLSEPFQRSYMSDRFTFLAAARQPRS